MTSLVIALSQHVYRIGNLMHNAQRMAQLATQAASEGVQLIAFPELALCGYPPEDLVLRPSLDQRVQQAFEPLLAVRDIVMVVGYPHTDSTTGKRYNAAAVILNGEIRARYFKQNLPNSSVFDERRYFEPGPQQLLIELHGTRIGLQICEDIWHAEPTRQLKAMGAELILVLNASPFEQEKQQHRIQTLRTRCAESDLPIAYVNCVGAQDDLVFDGGSLVMSADGSIRAAAPRFQEALLTAEFDLSQRDFAPQRCPPELTLLAETYQALVMGVRDYVNHSGFPGVVLGLSGGIDSALSLAIAVDALGAERVNAVMMPYHYTASISVEDAAAQAQRLGVAFHVAPIHGIVQGFLDALHPFFGDRPQDATEENLQARARGTLLMALSNKFGHLVLTTGNKSEMAVGYATLYGDMAGGFDVLKDVYKTQVFALARYRNTLEASPVIPERVIERPPSAELRPDQTDQDSLPPYEVLDAILEAYIERDESLAAIVATGLAPEGTVRRVIRMVDRNEYKRRQAAIGPRMTERAFGRERRYPLVNGWEPGI